MMKRHKVLAGVTSFLTAVVLTAAPLLTAVAEGYPFRTSSTYYYDQFGTEEKALYDGMLLACRLVDESADDYTTVPNVPYAGLTYEQMADLVIIFMYDHPEFFWLKNSYNYGYSREGNYVALNIYDAYQSGAARASARSEIIAIEQAYINGALQWDTDYERANYLSRQLRSDITYQQGDLDQSLASALLQKKTVCAGFTKAYSLLANAVGVDTVSLMSPGHGWNATKIADVWYHNDVTNQLFLYSDSEIAAFDTQAGYTVRTDSDGNVTRYRMHDLDYEYYTTIFPDTSQAYNGASAVIAEMPETPTEPSSTEPATEPSTEPDTQVLTEPETPTEPVSGDTQHYYEADPQTRYYYAGDTTGIVPSELLTTLWDVNRTTSGYSVRTTKSNVTDLSGLRLADGWESPAAIFAQHTDGAPYFHGSLQATFRGEALELGDVWIVHRGDFDGNGVTNAGDASEILIYAAILGAGGDAVYPEGMEPELALFAGKMTDSDAATLSAADAAALLSYIAALGAGSQE